MNSSHLIPLLTTLAIVPVSLTGCGPRKSAASGLRPDAPTVAGATGRNACRNPNERADVLVVDLPPEQRADLEAAMKQGVAVVSYDCKTLRLLGDCYVKGHYTYVPVSPKEQLVKLTDADQVRANLPVTGASLAVRLGGYLERGASLDVAMKMVGKQMSSPVQARENELVGHCNGATHIVRGATLGAFVMQTSTRADVQAAAQVFAASTSASSSSDHSILNRDGDPAQCDSATGSDKAPPARCSAIVRLELSPVQEVLPAAVDLREDKQKSPTRTQSVSCSFGEIEECSRLCAQRDGSACFMLGGSYHRGINTPVNLAKANELYDKACNLGFQPGCVLMGIQYLRGKQWPKGMELLQRACRLHEVTGCSTLGDVFDHGLHPDPVKAREYYEKACKLGSKASCDALKKYER